MGDRGAKISKKIFSGISKAILESTKEERHRRMRPFNFIATEYNLTPEELRQVITATAEAISEEETILNVLKNKGVMFGRHEVINGEDCLDITNESVFRQAIERILS